jgi:hypothetical protein
MRLQRTLQLNVLLDRTDACEAQKAIGVSSKVASYYLLTIFAGPIVY